MYDNIGRKIKALAKLAAWLGVIASVVSGFILLVNASKMYSSWPLVLSGLLVMIVGSLIAWISSWMLYGFGELVDKTDEIAKNTRH